MKLSEVLNERGCHYDSHFTSIAEDIDFDNEKEICYCLGYILKNIKRIDAEIPENQMNRLQQIIPNYPIKLKKLTSGGHDMKWGSQYRIYFNSIDDIPEKLCKRLQNDEQMRMTGSKFIESCFFLGFAQGPGEDQNFERILQCMKQIFSKDEVKIFEDAYNS